MYLIFSDECGTDFGDRNVPARDGSFFIYGGIAVTPAYYMELERLFYSTVRRVFGITSRFDQEIHAGEIFYRKGFFSKFEESASETFFSEVVQLIGKMHVPIICGIQSKIPNATNQMLHNGEKENIASGAIFSFLNGCERFLGSRGQNGLIVADSINCEADRSINGLKNLSGKNGLKTETVLNRIFYDMQKWRIDPDGMLEPRLTTRYFTESRAVYLIDNIHYTDSKLSPMSQLVDCMLFCISRLFEKVKLFTEPFLQDQPIDYRIPLDDSSVGILISSLHSYHYSSLINDVHIHSIAKHAYLAENVRNIALTKTVLSTSIEVQIANQFINFLME